MIKRMKKEVKNIDLGKLQKELRRHENHWVAISSGNRIVGSGATYGEAVENAGKKEVILFRVPPLDASLAPST